MARSRNLRGNCDGATARKRSEGSWSHDLDYRGTKHPVLSLLRHVTLASRILPGQHGLSWIWSVAEVPWLALHFFPVHPPQEVAQQGFGSEGGPLAIMPFAHQARGGGELGG
jgi:hypothetical protein